MFILVTPSLEEARRVTEELRQEFPGERVHIISLADWPIRPFEKVFASMAEEFQTMTMEEALPDGMHQSLLKLLRSQPPVIPTLSPLSFGSPKKRQSVKVSMGIQPPQYIRINHLRARSSLRKK
jgi:hypothetical protein